MGLSAKQLFTVIRKICIVITARASYARVKSVLAAIHQQKQLELMLILTASAVRKEYGELEKQIAEDGFTIAGKVHCLGNAESPAYQSLTTAVAIMKMGRLFELLKPDIVVTIADRFETMATAITATYMNIPLAHIQGGEVTGNIDERVRHAVTKLADFHFVATEGARRRVIRLGENPASVFLTGCPSIDLALSESAGIDFSPPADFADLSPGGYLMILQHPVTTEAAHSAQQIRATIEAIRDLHLPVLWFMPNADSGRVNVSTEICVLQQQSRNVRILRHLPPHEFLHLLRKTACLIGNSSTGIREAAALGVPAVNVGNRQSGRERGGNVIDVPHDAKLIREAILFQLDRKIYPPDYLYGCGAAGESIASLLANLPLTIEKKITY